MDLAQLVRAGEPVAERLGLASSEVGEAGAALTAAHDTLDVRLGLAVADEDDLVAHSFAR